MKGHVQIILFLVNDLFYKCLLNVQVDIPLTYKYYPFYGDVFLLYYQWSLNLWTLIVVLYL